MEISKKPNHSSKVRARKALTKSLQRNTHDYWTIKTSSKLQSHWTEMHMRHYANSRLNNELASCTSWSGSRYLHMAHNSLNINFHGWLAGENEKHLFADMTRGAIGGMINILLSGAELDPRMVRSVRTTLEDIDGIMDYNSIAPRLNFECSNEDHHKLVAACASHQELAKTIPKLTKVSPCCSCLKRWDTPNFSVDRTMGDVMSELLSQDDDTIPRYSITAAPDIVIDDAKQSHTKPSSMGHPTDHIDQVTPTSDGMRLLELPQNKPRGPSTALKVKSQSNTMPGATIAVSGEQEEAMIQSSGNTGILSPSERNSDTLSSGHGNKETTYLSQRNRDSTFLHQGNRDTPSLSQESRDTTSISQGSRDITSLSQGNRDATSISQGSRDTTSLSQGNRDATSISKGSRDTASLSQRNRDSTPISKESRDTTSLSQRNRDSTLISQESRDTTSLKHSSTRGVTSTNITHTNITTPGVWQERVDGNPSSPVTLNPDYYHLGPNESDVKTAKEFNETSQYNEYPNMSSGFGLNDNTYSLVPDDTTLDTRDHTRDPTSTFVDGDNPSAVDASSEWSKEYILVSGTDPATHNKTTIPDSEPSLATDPIQDEFPTITMTPEQQTPSKKSSMQ